MLVSQQICSSESGILVSSAKGAASLVNLLTLLHIQTRAQNGQKHMNLQSHPPLQKLVILSWLKSDNMVNADDPN